MPIQNMKINLKKFSGTYAGKLFFTYSIVTLCSLFCMIAIYYASTMSIITTNARENGEALLTQLNTQINYNVEQTSAMLKGFILDLVFLNSLSREYDSQSQHEAMTKVIMPKCASALVMVNYDVSLKLYIDNESLNQIYYNDFDDRNLINRKFYEIIRSKNVKENDWYKSFLDSEKVIMWGRVGNDEEYGNISAMIKLIDFQTMKMHGVLRAVFNESDFFCSEDVPDKMSIKITSGDEDVYLSSEITQHNKSSYSVIKQPISESDNWDIYLYSNIGIERSIIIKNLAFIFAIFISFLAIFMIINYFISKSVGKKVKTLITGIDYIKNCDFDNRIEIKNEDEFSNIADALNMFSSSMKHLINDVYEANSINRKNEIMILRSKINPHSLCNILNIIGQLSKIGKNDEIQKIVKSTAEFYRLVLDDTELFITVLDEITYIEHYIKLIDIKYAGSVLFNIDKDESLDGCMVPSFIIQPFIENVINHAIYREITNISIIVRQEDDFVIIEVKDDGIGMTDEQLKSIGASHTKGYGIYNVNERIVMLCGGECGVEISSEYNVGTNVRIKLPKRL